MKKGILFILIVLSLILFIGCDKKPAYNYIDKIEATVDLENYTVASDITCELTGNKDVEYIKIVFSIPAEDLFESDLELYINGEKIETGYTVNAREVIYKFINPNYVQDPTKLLTEVRFTLDTLNYTCASENTEAYSAKVESDSNYTYITTTITLNAGYKLDASFDVYVNSEKVTENFVINDERTELVYKIKDPNWTPTY